MNCPECGGKTTVWNISHTDRSENLRKRKCLDCGHRFNTIEFVVKNDETFKKLYTKFYRKSAKQKAAKEKNKC